MTEQKIGIISDSACNLSPALQKKLGIPVVPLQINFIGKSYADGVDLSPEQLYSMMEKELPKSSLPASGDVWAAFETMKARGYTDVIFITISSGLSGCYNFIRLLAEGYKDLNIVVYDSKILSCGQQSLVLRAKKEIEAGATLYEVLLALDQLRARISSYFVVRTLEYLSKGGRIGKVAGTVGSLLHLNPVISVNSDGVYITAMKTIGFGRALDAMVKDVEAKYKGKNIVVSLVHAANERDARLALAKIKRFANVVESYIEPVSPVLGIHTGPGLVGLVCFEADC